MHHTMYHLQDCRGRYKSEGRFTKYTSEGDDGVDTLGWICAQPWCNGKVTLIHIDLIPDSDLDPGF